MSGAGQAIAPAFRPLLVFISYSHLDDQLRQKFITALSQLKRDGLIKSWDDREITAGSEWAGKIDARLNVADLVVCLVSPDFLASRYCYDIEMQRALERHDNRETRVIPIILRPCDWRHSPLAQLNALPREGKPVVDWPSLDHALLNVAQGLRVVAQELRAPVEEIPQVTRQRTLTRAVPRKFLLLIAAALVLLSLAAWFLFFEHQRSEQMHAYASRGNSLLDVGRYRDALKPFQDAHALEPANAQANLGIQIANLAADRSDAVTCQQVLAELLKQSPNESHLRVLNGDNLLAQGDQEAAMREYSRAIKINKHLAEAHFRLGVLYDKQQKLGHALAEYQQAVDISPYSPQYRDNLADCYFKHGEYANAIAQYAHLDRFPLAALESANINRLLGNLAEAREQQLTAIGWLSDKDIPNLPENQLPWYFTRATEGISIVDPTQKLCYARFQVATTMYLQGDTSQAADNTKQALQACGVRSINVKTAVRWDLERVASERTELKAADDAYSEQFLTH